MGKRNRNGDLKDVMMNRLVLSTVFSFFSLRDLCTWCPRVCTLWCDCAYSDPRWRVLDTKRLQIWDDAKLKLLAARRDPGFPMVQEIFVSSQNISGSTLPDLVKKCPSLKKLDVRSVSVNHLLRTISHCTNLTSLHLPFFHESTVDDIIKILSYLPSLQHFHFDYFVPLAVVKFVAHNYKENQILTFKATYPTLDKPTITTFLQKFKTLQKLTIYTASGLDDAVISHLGPTLRSLNMLESSYDLTDTALEHLSHNCTNLEKLAIGGVYAGEDLRHHLMDKVTDAGLTALSKLPKLKIFTMSHVHFSPEGIQQFMRARRDSLKRLDLSQIASLTDVVLMNVAKNAMHLEELRLNCLNVTFGGFELAAHFLPNLKRVSFSWCQGLVEPLEHKVPWGQKIEILQLDSCENLGDNSLIRIATMCGASLRTFKIDCSNKVSDKALIYLSKHCQKLRKFCASENHSLSDSSYAIFLANLKSTLEKVYLQETHAGTKTYEAMNSFPKDKCIFRILNTGQLYL